MLFSIFVHKFLTFIVLCFLPSLKNESLIKNVFESSEIPKCLEFILFESLKFFARVFCNAYTTIPTNVPLCYSLFAVAIPHCL